MVLVQPLTKQAAADVRLCVPCAVGNYSDLVGVSQCEACPAGAEDFEVRMLSEMAGCVQGV